MFMVMTKYIVAWEDPAGEWHQLSLWGEDHLRHLLNILATNSFKTITVTDNGDGMTQDQSDDPRLDLHQGV